MLPKEELAEARILIIDDAPEIVRLLTFYLNAEGLKNVKGVTDSLKALDVYRDFQPHLVILDLIMPVKDGFSVMEDIRRLDPDTSAVLVLTSQKEQAIRIQALNSGARDFLTKPFDRAEALARIANLLQMSLLYGRVRDQNRHLERVVAQRTRELQETRFQIIKRLGKAAEYKDEDTGLHIMRMSRMCGLLAYLAGLPIDRCELMEQASPMHDIGKIGIPDHILQKQGSLTHDEYEVMKTHTTIGADLLSGDDSKLLQVAGSIALNHHEHWDGKGYPSGATGEEIPVEGRICAICDTFDALTSRRPYKSPWTPVNAAAELHNLKGRNFDPQLVDTFLEHLPEMVEAVEDIHE
ncbi:MAG: response regulator [Deltaproteobacteria bacterium]|nr:response regulator [Deltaproteobacteria bacterium]